jgi:hypothetical protein
MSGGAWGYQQYRIEEKAVEIAALLRAVAESEHIVDWSESCDTLREDAERQLYDLWVKTFNEVYG